ncbi:MAG: Histidine triad [Candidatus Shapirobacteria bacterium GW2011_GWE1_38_10]|uniref:Histidine triad n=1 Tax=Candidatus Shapirobacteria bacterium GW2011_GWE1_38_10 TaxID=1618488 RepID=A0A0G0I2R6_9BACT|nr:MAG: Histidine triad [Candidatus Shapirobacteria bacterium GW2011_GWF2_37_20]KKQ49583.1 MAG: Histidine triad [Candidatus Shapirobacteria bacterium GW2011_GWE1_38_10]HBP51278.1 diadenosine tetraphosphate hydrolase [Candidatus Shapirobacteria bacterium]
MGDCIFCKIIAGTSPAHKIWEDDKHLAFLSIFPNTPGFTVVASKKHLPSYFADNDDQVLADFIVAAKKVAKLIDAGFDDVGRTGLIAEGFGVDHLHLKLFPMHGTKTNEWQQHNSQVEKTFDKYEGYISSHNGPRVNDEELSKIADKIKP